ncbi:MAG TPA: 4Fe-4S binding protein [Rhabdaerophilum sp.]|nr:4Fe-4S binding protein [Rhabdaerophilum sp.]
MSRNNDRTGCDTVFICSCEKTFHPDTTRLGAVLGDGIKVIGCTQLCGAESGKLEKATVAASNITVACRQEESRFRDILEEFSFAGTSQFLDIRDSAGWSSEGENAQPKMAALLAMGRMTPPALPFVTLESNGVALVYGSGETAIEVGARLADALDVTVMLHKPDNVAPASKRVFPVARGTIRTAKGYLGAFELTVDDFALATPSSRAAYAFGEPRNGAASRCDLILDLTGGRPLFAADTLRDGYLRADPRDPLAVERIITKARDLVGTFDKPKYIDFKPELCAHSRSGIAGCTRCLDVCPTGAITPAGDAVSIDPQICAGCGGCGSVCPTGAASYALPAPDHLMRKLRTLLLTYAKAGGRDGIVLFHDADHGGPIIEALARFGDGLPARVLPVAVNEVTQVGIEQVAASFAYGAVGIAFLVSDRPAHDLLPLDRLEALADSLLPALGHPRETLTRIATGDPDALLAGLRAMPAGLEKAAVASFQPAGGKRQVMMLALREWHAVSPTKPGRIQLPKGAPFGKVEVKAEGCTLCLACVSACPVSALSANPDSPELRFQEDLCVQCGLCQSTCPEKVISLTPQLDFSVINAAPVTLKQEEPYACDNCGTLFGTKSTIERIKTKLAGQHWMFSGANADRLKVIGYCDTCRIEAATLGGFDPHGGPPRPLVRTSEDYFREREEDKDS